MSSTRKGRRPFTIITIVENLEPRKLLSSAAVSINANTVYQTMTGFGAGMTNDFTRKEYLDPAFFDTIVNDLGATVTRTSINPAFESSNDNNDPNTFNFAGYNTAALAQPMGFLQQMKARG